MTHGCQTRGTLVNSVSLLVAVICVSLNPTKGKSIVELTEPSGEFQSPGYPDLDDNMLCTWTITAPQYHRINVKFLDFELEEVFFCSDEVKIYEGDVTRGTYKGTSLHQQTISSFTNTISVDLISCGTSFLFDRRGFRALYSTVYPTSPVYGTSTAAARRTTATSFDSTNELTGGQSRSSPLPTSSENSGERGTENLIGVLLSVLMILAIFTVIIVLVVKRRNHQYSISTLERMNANQSIKGLSAAVSGGPEGGSCQSEYDYVQDCQSQKAKTFYVKLDKDRGILAENIDSCRAQSKHPNIRNDQCVYESYASNECVKKDFYYDYSTILCTIQQPTPKVENKFRQFNTQTSEIDLDQDMVLNSAYEAYLPET